MICQYCGACYVKTHKVCHGGQCPKCLLTFKNLKTHGCAMDRCLTTFKDLEEEQKSFYYCAGCRTPFSSRAHLRIWKGWDFCGECYSCDPIQNEIEQLRFQLHQDLLMTGQSKCAKCKRTVLSESGQTLIGFEADHICPFTKCNSVGTMLFQGSSLVEMLEEMKLCRILCRSCHSVVTHAQNCRGLRGLLAIHKDAPLSTERQFVECVGFEELADALLLHAKR